MKKIILIIFILITISSFGAVNYSFLKTKEDKLYYGGDKLFSGTAIAYFDDGKISSRGTYKEGLQNGKWEVYYPNGDLRYIGYSKNGKEEGIRFSYKNGEVASMNLYIQGKKQLKSKLVDYLKDQFSELSKYENFEVIDSFENKYILFFASADLNWNGLVNSTYIINLDNLEIRELQPGVGKFIKNGDYNGDIKFEMADYIQKSLYVSLIVDSERRIIKFLPIKKLGGDLYVEKMKVSEFYSEWSREHSDYFFEKFEQNFDNYIEVMRQ